MLTFVKTAKGSKLNPMDITIEQWQEVVAFCMDPMHEGWTPKAAQYAVAQQLGYEISETQAALALIRF